MTDCIFAFSVYSMRDKTILLPRNKIVKNYSFYLKSTVFTLVFALILISHREFDFIHLVNERQLMEDIPRCGLKPFVTIVFRL